MAFKWGWILRLWLPIAVALTGSAAVAYAAVQQDLRLSANDPQIQISEDTAASMAGGKDPNSVLPAEKVDAAASLAVFMILFDETGKPMGASVHLSGQTPLPPPGVLDYARSHGQNRFTWQPTPGVRLATVVTHYTSGSRSGFVLVGRSMREVEKRVDVVGNLVGLGWILSLGATLVVCAAVSYVRSE